MAEVEYRHATPSDVAAMTELFNDASRADGVPQVVDVDELAEELTSERTAIATDTRLAVEADRLVGAVYTIHIPSPEAGGRCYIDGTVAADRRGRGIGRTLLAWAVEHGRDLLADDAPPTSLRADAYEQCPADHRLFTRAGFTPVRWFEELIRPLDDLPDVTVPDGVSIEVWPLDREDELRSVRNATFADHWGSAPSTPASWHEQLHGFGSRLDLSFVALDADGRVVGLCKCARYEADDTATGRRDGWISTLGTLAGWRGRGVASALVAASMRAFADAGLTHAVLGVDSDSPTGANRLYRSLGFDANQRSTVYQLDVVHGLPLGAGIPTSAA